MNRTRSEWNPGHSGDGSDLAGAAGVILLVDDNPDDRDLTERALRQNGIANPIIVAHDGAEALDYLFGSGKYAGRNVALTPQLILLDLKLPRMDGLQVLERIHADERMREVPVVVLTSSDEERDLARSHELGANTYLRKSVDFIQFSKAVGELAPRWLLSKDLSRSRGNT